MTDWKYRINGIRECLTEDASPDGVRAAAKAIAQVLTNFANTHTDQQINKPELEEIIEGINNAGQDGDVNFLNEMLADMYDWCDENLVWVEPKGD